MMNCFFQTIRFSLHKMLIDGVGCGLLVDYCDVLINCLDSHSDGTHSMQRIHWWTAIFFQICFDEETNFSTSWMARGWVKILVDFHFLVHYSFQMDLILLALRTTFPHSSIQCFFFCYIIYNKIIEDWMLKIEFFLCVRGCKVNVKCSLMFCVRC